MVKNNHQFHELESELLGQDFVLPKCSDSISRYKNIAEIYANVENSIAVLSDLAHKCSYIYYGAMASKFRLSQCAEEQIDSIWEESIYNLIHPDDLRARNIQELHYFMLLKKCPVKERHNFSTYSNIRMQNSNGQYISILHRTIYLRSSENGAIWLALCLYNFSCTEPEPRFFSGVIQNSATGEIFNYNEEVKILSQREIEVLKHIDRGLLSKEIALELDISVNTIHRHRQNIIEKLCVNSSIEAITRARHLRIIH